MRVLITGGAGFIGSHLSDTLQSQGYEVTIVDNFSTGSLKNLEHIDNKVKIFNGDIRNVELVESLVEKSDLVFHMAAALGVDNILKNPLESISINIYGSEVVLKAATKFKKRILIASTSEIYGKNSNQPLGETFDRVIGPPQKLRWSYADSKALEEATAHHLYETQKLRVTTVRLFNTVGPRQTGEYGMVIPRFVKSAISGNQVKVFGDGCQTRVFCHVKDVVSAIISLAQDRKTIGEVFNIGGNTEISINELASRIIKLTNSKSTITNISYATAYLSGFEDMERRVPDISKIKKFIGWEPKIDLDNIILDVARFINQSNLSHP